MHPLPSRALLSLGHVTCIPRKEVAKAEEEEERRERVGPRLARPRDSSKVLLVWGSPLSAATLPTIALELSIRTSNAARRLCSPRRHDDVPSIPRAAYDRACPTGINRAPRCRAHVFTPRGCDSAVPLTVAVAAWPRRSAHSYRARVCVCHVRISLPFASRVSRSLTYVELSLFLSLLSCTLSSFLRRASDTPRRRVLTLPPTPAPLLQYQRSPGVAARRPRAIKYHDFIDPVVFYRYSSSAASDHREWFDNRYVLR